MSGTVSTNSPWMQLMRETGQSHDLRRPILARLEEHFDAFVVSFFAAFNDYNAQIHDDDAEIIESILAAELDTGRKLVLIINSPGGQALAAERIANVCRAYSDGNFEVVVPHMAKSAATMICFGSRKIHMSRTAELGPVDPQVAYETGGSVMRLSAEEYVRSYDDLMRIAASGKAKRIEPYIQQLQKYDARYIEYLKSQQQLSRDISVRLLKTGMLSAHSVKQINAKIRIFLSQKQMSSHGRMINSESAVACGLKVQPIDLRSDVWNDLWALYVRSDWAVSNRQLKIIESKDSPLGVSRTQ